MPTPRYNYNTWRYQKQVCPYCGKTISQNWFYRHKQTAHPDKVKEELEEAKKRFPKPSNSTG